MQSPRVTIIGAGIVGISSALWLQREGFEVTIIDQDSPGSGASFGNAGNISPGAVVPYTIPGVLRQVPGWLLDPNGPLVVRPGHALKVLPWLMRVARSSTAEAALRTSRLMRQLHQTAFEAYEELTRGTAAEKLIERSGQLYVSERPGGAQGSLLTQFMREAAGVRTLLLDEHAIREQEPALAPIFKSGMLLPDNGRVRDPHRLVQLMAEEAVRRGARFVRNSVLGFDVQDRCIRALKLDGGLMAVERVVVAAGAASGKLTAQLGLSIPIEAERGYHITVAAAGAELRIPVMNVDAKFAVSPMDVGLRFAGTVEYAGAGAPPNWRRAALLERQALRMFPGIRMDQSTRWAGDRPTLPDGLPVLGHMARCNNAFLAFGNSHFGMTAGPMMGRLVSALVAGQTPEIDIAPFAPGRFD